MKNKILLLFVLLMGLSISVIAADSNLTTISPIPQVNSFASTDGEILDVDTGSLDVSNTSYSYFNLVNNGFNAFALSYIITATTLTFEGTLDQEVTGDANSNYVDITGMLTEDLYSQITITGSLTVSKAVPWNRIRVKRVTTNPTNALELRLTRLKY